jgi:hypothetical protein
MSRGNSFVAALLRYYLRLPVDGLGAPLADALESGQDFVGVLRFHTQQFFGQLAAHRIVRQRQERRTLEDVEHPRTQRAGQDRKILL